MMPFTDEELRLFATLEAALEADFPGLTNKLARRLADIIDQEGMRLYLVKYPLQGKKALDN